jgi:hypothetical protein
VGGVGKFAIARIEAGSGIPTAVPRWAAAGRKRAISAFTT